jgi:Ankyrin repeats (3 copies)
MSNYNSPSRYNSDGEEKNYPAPSPVQARSPRTPLDIYAHLTSSDHVDALLESLPEDMASEVALFSGYDEHRHTVAQAEHDLPLLKYLLDHNLVTTRADLERALVIATNHGWIDGTMRLLQMGADAFVGDGMFAFILGQQRVGETSIDRALFLSCHAGQLDLVKYLVSVGADSHARNDFAVQYASANGHLEVVKYLVSLGADIRADNNTAVRWAIRGGHPEVVQYLVSLGSTPYPALLVNVVSERILAYPEADGVPSETDVRWRPVVEYLIAENVVDVNVVVGRVMPIMSNVGMGTRGIWALLNFGVKAESIMPWVSKEELIKFIQDNCVDDLRTRHAFW